MFRAAQEVLHTRAPGGWWPEMNWASQRPTSRLPYASSLLLSVHNPSILLDVFQHRAVAGAASHLRCKAVQGMYNSTGFSLDQELIHPFWYST